MLKFDPVEWWMMQIGAPFILYSVCILSLHAALAHYRKRKLVHYLGGALIIVMIFIGIFSCVAVYAPSDILSYAMKIISTQIATAQFWLLVVKTGEKEKVIL